MKDLLKELGVSRQEFKRLAGEKKYKPKIIQDSISNNVLKFGVVSDTHFCSKLARMDELHTFYQICAKEGIRHIVHSGDVLDGWRIFRGQENEVHTFGAMNQVQYVINNYPKVNGVTTHFITGNHDLCWWNNAGIEVGELISQRRPDMVYLGQYQGDVILNGVVIRLHHGESGGAYAISYKPQKILEQIPSGKKPHIMIFGHWHISFYFFYRLIHTLQAGCFQDQSTYLLRKGLNPTIGGWTVKVRVANDKKKSIVAVTPTFIPFFK
jgi:predicted phosphodiesterase